MTKEELRKELLWKRKKMPKETRSEENAEILQHVKDLLEESKNITTIALYYSTKHEVDTVELLTFLATREDTKVLMPRTINEEGEIILVELTKESSFIKGLTGMWEPSNNEPSPLTPDVFFLPCVGIDPEGHRLGRGGGSIDKYLANHKLFTMALAFSNQVVESIPTEEHDMSISGVITPIGPHFFQQ